MIIFWESGRERQSLAHLKHTIKKSFQVWSLTQKDNSNTEVAAKLLYFSGNFTLLFADKGKRPSQQYIHNIAC